MEGKEIKELLIKHGITPQTIDHNNEKRIKLEFEFSEGLTKKVKDIPGRRWSETLNAWHVPFSKQLLINLIESFDDVKSDERDIPYWM